LKELGASLHQIFSAKKVKQIYQNHSEDKEADYMLKAD